MDSNHPQPDLRCAIVGHPSRFEGIPQHMTALRDAWATATVADLASEMEDLHDFWCNCGLDLGLTEYIWRTDLVCEQDRDAALEIYHPSKSNAQRLDQHTLLRDIVLSPLEDLYQVTIHVMLGRDLGISCVLTIACAHALQTMLSAGRSSPACGGCAAMCAACHTAST